MSDQARPIMAPTWSMILFRSLFVVTMTVFAFAAYSLIRPLFGTFGFEPGTTMKSAGAVLALGIFVVWLIPMVDLHIAIFEHVVPGRRFKQGRCPECGHPRSPGQETSYCSECGGRNRNPESWRLTKRTVFSFLIWMLVGLFLGSCIAETRLSIDEREWIQECRTLEGMSEDALGFRTRKRSWPSSYSELYYRSDRGAYAEPLVTHERMRRTE